MRDAADHAKELELTVKMQKSIINDLELRLGEEKALCAGWRKRALLAEKELGASGGRIATAAPRNDEDVKRLKFKKALVENGGPVESCPCKEEQTVEEQAPELRPYNGDPYALYKRAIKAFGARAQKLKCVEELLELALALVRDQFGRSDPVNIAEERADVGIMLQQLAMIQDDQEAVDAWAQEKLRRLEQLAEAEEEKTAERLRRYADD